MKNYNQLFKSTIIVLFVLSVNLSFMPNQVYRKSDFKLKDLIQVAFAGGEDCWWGCDLCSYYPETMPCPAGSDYTHYLYCEPTCDEDDCFPEWQTPCND